MSKFNEDIFISHISMIKKIIKQEENILSFREFKFIPEMYNVLDRLNVNAPTSIQSVAIPKIMEKKNVFFASQTGTGKTFTYLLPLLNELKEMESSLSELVNSGPGKEKNVHKTILNEFLNQAKI